MTAGITKWVVVDVDMDGWDIGLGTILSDVTGSLTKIIEGKTIRRDNAVRIGIVVMLIEPTSTSRYCEEHSDSLTIFRAHKLISS